MMMSNDKRQLVHGMWAGVAEQWTQRADFIDRRAAAVTKALLDGAAIGSADRVLVLADGPGGLGLAAARIAAEVVSSDVVPSYADIVNARAHAAGLANVTAKVLDLEEIAEADDSFDAVVIREGLMFAVDPSAALGEIRRVLRGDGRLAAAVWGPKADNPWLAIVMDAVSAQVGHEVPPPGMPGPFALADELGLGRLAREVGFREVRVDHVAVRFHASSFDEWWKHTSALAGPIAGIVANLCDDAKAELLRQLRAASSPYETSDGLDIPGLSLVLTACR
jgi:ubiquinone/menaquinone biosynthesis C-methylase UbiE